MQTDLVKNDIAQPEIKTFNFSFSLIYKAVIYLIASIVLIHFFSVGGIFLAFALPLWWFISPTSTTCFFCRVSLSDSYCPVCREKILDRADCYPKNVRSVAINVLLIVGLTLLSIGFLYGETRVLNYFGIPKTPKTVSFVISDKGQYQVGTTFPMKIEIVGIETPVNAIQADFRFDPELLKVVNIDTRDSFANIFLQKEIDNILGFARLTGGLPNPGYVFDRGLFGTIYFEGKNTGVAEVEFLPTSMVLANDGRGTNVLKEFGTAAYLILPKTGGVEKEIDQLNLSLLEPAVAEAATSSTQLIFYEEDRVLGVGIDSTPSPEPSSQDLRFNLGSFILDGSLNKTILSFFFKYTIYTIPPLLLFLLALCFLDKLRNKNAQPDNFKPDN